MKEQTVKDLLQSMKEQIALTNAEYVSTTLTFRNEPYVFSCTLSSVEEKDQYEEIEEMPEELQNLMIVLEGVWNCPAELLDREEMLHKIMEAYRKYRKCNHE